MFVRNFIHPMKGLALFLNCFAGFAFSLNAESILVSTEATVQSGSVAGSNIDETTAGYIHVKFHAALTAARKAYFQFNLVGQTPDLESPATFSISFLNTYQQRIQLWGLNQPYAAFSPDITWNNAQANDTNSNSLLTSGPSSATAIGGSALVPTSGTLPFTFTLPRLGDFVFGNRLTLALSGVDDPANNAAGLRLTHQQRQIRFFRRDQSTPVGNEHFDVYLVGGQSNMDGRGNTSDLVGAKAFWNQPQTNVQIYYANPVNEQPTNPTYNSGWQIFKPGFCVPPGFSGPLPSPRFGPALSFAKTISDTTPNRRIALIKVTQGGTSLSSDWKPASGYMYATFTNIVHLALNELTNAGHSYTIRGMIWHQGESDSSGSALANYETNMTQLIAAVRRDVGITNLPFVVGEVATNKVVELRAAQFRLSENIPYVGFASADALITVDGTHFTSDGVLILGQRFAAGIEPPPVKFLAVTYTPEGFAYRASGLARSSCRLLSSTHLNSSPLDWTPVSTNMFDGAGEFSRDSDHFRIQPKVFPPAITVALPSAEMLAFHLEQKPK